MHKGVFGENVQNSKIKSQNAQSLHASVRTMKSRAWQKYWAKMRKMAWQQGFWGVYCISIT